MAKPADLLVGMATLAALGLAAGYLVTRDRETLRRVVRIAAGSVERVSAALAETREELADLWAEARDATRREMDEAAFATAEEPFAEAPAPAVEEPPGEVKPAPRKRTARRAPAR
jgi:hypothetical protein